MFASNYRCSNLNGVTFSEYEVQSKKYEEGKAR
jgi:hypothetical protein